MANRVEVTSRGKDTRAEMRLKKIKAAGFNIGNVSLTDVYTIDDTITETNLPEIAAGIKIFENGVKYFQ